MSEPIEPDVELSEDDTKGEEIHPPAPGDEAPEVAAEQLEPEDPQ